MVDIDLFLQNASKPQENEDQWESWIVHSWWDINLDWYSTENQTESWDWDTHWYWWDFSSWQDDISDIEPWTLWGWNYMSVKTAMSNAMKWMLPTQATPNPWTFSNPWDYTSTPQNTSWGYFDIFNSLWETNVKIYKQFNILQLIFIVVWMSIATYVLWVLKETIVYLILYNAQVFSFFEWMQIFLVLLIYYLIVLWVLNYLDWVWDKERETLQNPFKILLLAAWMGYLANMYSFNDLFTIFFFATVPLLFIRVFCFSHQDLQAQWQEQYQEMQADMQQQVVQDNPQNAIQQELIAKWVESFDISVPTAETAELLTETIEEEEEPYDLGKELVSKNQEKNASCFLISPKLKLYYFFIEEQNEPLPNV